MTITQRDIREHEQNLDWAQQVIADEEYSIGKNLNNSQRADLLMKADPKLKPLDAAAFVRGVVRRAQWGWWNN